MTKDTIKQALEAAERDLETLQRNVRKALADPDYALASLAEVSKAIAALSTEQQEEAQPHPVGEITGEERGYSDWFPVVAWYANIRDLPKGTKLYTAAPSAAPVQTQEQPLLDSAQLAILNKGEIDTWLFEHAVIQGHKCDAIKICGRNEAWKDTVSGEVIDIVYENGIVAPEATPAASVQAVTLTDDDILRVWYESLIELGGSEFTPLGFARRLLAGSTKTQGEQA